jgi:hypothetical protein
VVPTSPNLPSIPASPSLPIGPLPTAVPTINAPGGLGH